MLFRKRKKGNSPKVRTRWPWPTASRSCLRAAGREGGAPEGEPRTAPHLLTCSLSSVIYHSHSFHRVVILTIESHGWLGKDSKIAQQFTVKFYNLFEATYYKYLTNFRRMRILFSPQTWIWSILAIATHTRKKLPCRIRNFLTRFKYFYNIWNISSY